MEFPVCYSTTFVRFMENRKKLIVENVAITFLERGIRSVTMDNVASEFGISKKTLYQYFSDKEALVNAAIDHLIESQRFEFNDPSMGNAIDIVVSIREQIASLLKMYHHNIESELKATYPEIHRKVYAVKRKKIYENTYANLRQGIAEGLYRNDIDPAFIARLQMGRILYTMNPDYHIFEEFEVHSVSFYDSIIDYHLRAICTRKGLEYYHKITNNVQHDTEN